MTANNMKNSVIDKDPIKAHTEESSNEQVQEQATKEVIPAVEVSLTGKHLIEASAGTGKTWTLTGIVLRLLIEARRSPEQIIATTFTRAAAAEMRERIHVRLVEFYQLLQWLSLISGNPENKEILYPKDLVIKSDSQKESSKNTKEPESQQTSDLSKAASQNQESEYESTISDAKRQVLNKKRKDWLVEQAKYAHYDKLIGDPVNLHLVQFLLNHVNSYPLSESIRRTALVLTTLDKLFVGTLDSLAQKWLTEYSSETGHQQNMSIIEDASIEQVTDSIIHDELRQFQSRLYHQQPKLYNLLDQQGKLTDVSDHRGHVRVSLNFISAPIDEVVSISFSFEGYERLISKIINNSDELDVFFTPNGEFYEAPKGQLKNNRASWPNIIEALKLYGVSAYNHISNNKSDTGKLIEAFQKTDDIGKQFYKTKDMERVNAHFNELLVVRDFKRYIEESKKLDDYVTTLLANLNRHIVLAVRERLPIILEERSQTTFSLQMVRLNQALSGKQGEKLARYIRHHYPVALIDESQDINGEQAMMIQNIYLPKNSKNNKGKERSNHEFLLLVGDPKQAIYGFRGGDVANYNFMKRQFDNSHIWTLDINRRSNAGLIDALNHWFSMPTRTANKQNRLASLGNNIYYQYIEADKSNAIPKLSWMHIDNQLSDSSSNNDTTSDIYQQVLANQAVSVINLPYDTDAEYNEHETTARHIATILKSGQTLEGKPIQPSDIGVLARAKKDLKQVEDELVKLNIPTLTTSDVSIFETIIAEDVAAVLSAMLHPYKHDMVNRVLTSHLYGLSVKQAKAMMIDYETGVAEVDDYMPINSTTKLVEVGLAEQTDVEKSASVQKASSRYDTNNQKSYQDFITYLKEGADRWQRYGILSALHYLFESSPVQSQGVWQTLAMHKEGDRHIMDLRQVMDMLAQYAMGMGEFELLAWFRQNIDEAPNSEWATQYPLPTESGVQLMTIHKSKGLEFPIVYVLGMDSASRKSGNREEYGLYLYNVDQDTSHSIQNASSHNSLNKTAAQRRFSPVQGTAVDKEYYINLETSENFDERKRLGYVAFTRASEQLYVVLKDPKDKREKERKPVVFWFDSDQKEYQLPERLKGIVGYLPGAQITEFYDSNYKNSSINSTLNVAEIGSASIKKEPINYDAFDKVMKETYFQGWAKTSFTALARQLNESTQAMAVVDERMDDAINLIQSQSSVFENVFFDENGMLIPKSDSNPPEPLKSDDDIRFTFIKGANAGTFLHEIYEKIDFKNKAQWSQVIDKAIYSYQLPLIYASEEQQQRVITRDNPEIKHKKQSRTQDNPGLDNLSLEIDTSNHEALVDWIDEVLHTPLLASNQALINIEKDNRSAELEFNMGLSDSFKAQDINKLFELYVPDKDKHINLLPKNHDFIYRYLRGEIDLVYEHAGRFHVVDYKSNFLGNSLSDYDESSLKKAMNKAGYWLQAAIYQVALHRFLSMRIADYEGNETKYLAPVEYVFLRGVYMEQGSSFLDSQLNNRSDEGSHLSQVQLFQYNQSRYGLVTWDIPIEFIKALDDLFGRPNS